MYGNKKFRKAFQPIVRRIAPSEILYVMSDIYRHYEAISGNSAEKHFWEKAWKSTRNLGSGMEKWFEEWLDEEREMRKKR